VFWSIAEYIYI